MSFELIFGFWVNVWVLGQFLAIGSIFCGFLAFGSIFGLWDDFGLFGRFLAVEMIFGFWLNDGVWVNSWPLGRFFVDFWPLVRFLAFGKIFGFLDNFCHLI